MAFQEIADSGQPTNHFSHDRDPWSGIIFIVGLVLCAIMAVIFFRGF
jgi:hypothetical protein